MSDDPWEDLRRVSVDHLITSTKLQGSVLSLQGWTTPEGWPFVVVVSVAKPGNEKALELALEYHEKLTHAGYPVEQVALNPRLQRAEALLREFCEKGHSMEREARARELLGLKRP